MSAQKKKIREVFRDRVFRRAQFHCEGPGCSFQSSPEKAQTELDAHHITNRNEMPNGGYVAENGIALCALCHEKAEQFHSTGTAVAGFSPAELYTRIGSSLKKALDASQKSERSKEPSS